MKLQTLQTLERRLGFLARDTINLLQFGLSSPKACEPIYVRVADIQGLPLAKKRLLGGKRKSGMVINGKWPVQAQDLVPLHQLEKIQHCLAHWVDDIPWQDTGSFNFYRSHPMATVLERHDRLDEIFQQVKADGRLRSQQEVSPRAFREHNGVRINLGPEGQLVFVDGGTHRLGMALALGLDVIVAELGVVHRDALPLLSRLRQHPAL